MPFTPFRHLLVAALAAGALVARGAEVTPAPPAPAGPPPVGPSARAVAAEPAAAEPRAPVPQGQWVHTAQYGWVWMPHGRGYVTAPAFGAPSMFVYGPTLGWGWVVAPWVVGWGPSPWYGRGPSPYRGHRQGWRH
jgi:hypothetical protein